MLSVILPTYNESESIKTTIFSIVKVLESSKIDFEIIVSDDDSPDKTWSIVGKLAKKDSRIRVLRRKKDKGLSAAVVDGFLNAKGDYLMVMDADGQHDEKIIPEMYSGCNRGENDVVVGSRYVNGGEVGEWSYLRRLVSKVASLMAYPFLKKKYVGDPMSGFFMVKKDLFHSILPSLQISGYKILLDILFVSPSKIKIDEVPYTFKTRERGTSKLGLSVIFDYLEMLVLQFFKQYNILIKFLIVGGVGIFVNLFTLFMLVEYLGLFTIFASAIAVEVSVISNFFFNNFWTFLSRRKRDLLFVRFLKFNLVSLVALSVNVLVMFVLMSYGVWYLLAQFFGILVAFVINYAVNNLWVFKE